MATGQHSAPEAIVVRPRHHVENVRQDAIAAAQEIATEDGGEPDHLVTDAISWALGDLDQAPFTKTTTSDGAQAADLVHELVACRNYLQSTPWSEEADATIDSANCVLNLLEWLTGVDDEPPAYRRETQPGDLVGGRGLIVRPYLEIRRIIQEARHKIESGETSLGFGRAWHEGVIATLRWVEGETPLPPMAHSGGICRHPDSDGLPTKREIARERGAAEEHLQPLGYKHGDIPAQRADAVACTLRWLYGQTTTSPVTDDF